MARLSPVASSKEVFSPIASSSTTSKAESAKKSAAAAISPWKPVQKLIISLKADDSSTTDFEDDADVLSELETFNETNSSGPSGMSAEALRAFDNASPASIAMGSPSMAPCSPIDGENSMSASNDANEDSAPKNDAAKAPDAFQMKLDEYLKQVRAKTDATQDTRPSNDSMVQEKPKSAETTRPTEKSTIINLKQKTPVVSAVEECSRFPKHMALALQSTNIICLFFPKGGMSFANISAAGVSSPDQSNENIGKTKGTEIVSSETAETTTKCVNSNAQSYKRFDISQYSRHIEK